MVWEKLRRRARLRGTSRQGRVDLVPVSGGTRADNDTARSKLPARCAPQTTACAPRSGPTVTYWRPPRAGPCGSGLVRSQRTEFTQAALEVEHAATELAERYEEINLLYTIGEILGRTVTLADAAASLKQRDAVTRAVAGKSFAGFGNKLLCPTRYRERP